jgi:type VI secretion system protein ImpG
VLERFLGLYVSINSFSQLVARMPPDEELVSRWPPRAGEQILL